MKTSTGGTVVAIFHRRSSILDPSLLLTLALMGATLLIVIPVLNLVPATGSWWWVSDFSLNLLGKCLTYAILALGIDLIWGYTGILSLGHGLFFGLGAYCMGMHLMLAIGGEGVYQSALPDFMVWNQVKELPLFWHPFRSFWFTLVAIVLVPGLFAGLFGVLTFRSRIRGVYFSIITQALALSAWLLFNRNETNLGGTN
ncbi:MAG: ABC transporter permease subunit, partial [Candidatus Entotheonellia bacterium]